MAIDKEKYTSVLVNFPDTVLEKVEDYQFENRFKSRTQAIIHLVEKGLEQNEKEPK